jgi:hypothetical protein
MYVEISGAFRDRSLPVYPLLTLLLLFAPERDPDHNNLPCHGGSAAAREQQQQQQ